MPARDRLRAHRHRVATVLWRLPLRLRLVAGFAAAMLVVLTAAGGFVYLRVRYALDLRLDEDLAAQSAQLLDGLHSGGPPNATGGLFQVLDVNNQVLTASSGLAGRSLLNRDELARALHGSLRHDRGSLFSISSRPLRLFAVAVPPATTASGIAPPAGTPAIAVVAVRRDQRDEALRELIGQLALANLAALAVASLVGYRLAHAALVPVERYRTEAARIASGAAGVRLAVPDRAHDEVARLGRTLNDMLAALEAALERERRFVNDASHELRTPLTLLSAELELALRRPRTVPELEQTVRSAAADTADLITLADTLLAVGAQPDPCASTDVDLAQLAAHHVHRYPNPSVHTESASDGTAVVCGDPIRLGQVLTNLLDNATRHGTPPVTVTVRRVNGLVHLAVHDTGPGIDPDFLPHAAERFRRADTARTSPGTGLGLSLVHSIVDAHQGELRICSAGHHHRTDSRFDVDCAHPLGGTTVTVLLPGVEEERNGDWR